MEVGGEGTPRVREFCLAELAMVRQVHPMAGRALVADALDLQHRLPLDVGSRVTSLAAEPWVARKVASMTRARSPWRPSTLVDRAVAAIIGTESPSRVLAVTQAKIMEADPAAQPPSVEAERRRRYVTWSRARRARPASPHRPRHGRRRPLGRDVMPRPRRRPGRPRPPGRRPARRASLHRAGLVGASGRLADAPLTRAATVGSRRPTSSGCVRRSSSTSTSTRQSSPVWSPGSPASKDSAPSPWTGSATSSATPHHRQARPRPRRPGPTLVLRTPRRTSRNASTSSPAATGSPMPAATAVGADYDHPTAYQRHGPPGQTGTHNSAPLGRRHHRWKTHAGYTSRQCGDGRYVWRTPHGRYFLVDHAGTRPLDPVHGRDDLRGPARAWTSTFHKSGWSNPWRRTLSELATPGRVGARTRHGDGGGPGGEVEDALDLVAGHGAQRRDAAAEQARGRRARRASRRRRCRRRRWCRRPARTPRARRRRARRRTRPRRRPRA